MMSLSTMRDPIPPQGAACALRACPPKAYCPNKSDEIIILESKEGIVLFFYPGHASKSFILPRGQCNVFIHGMKKRDYAEEEKIIRFLSITRRRRGILSRVQKTSHSILHRI